MRRIISGSILFVTILAIFGLVTSKRIEASSRYIVTDLGVLDESSPQSEARGINDQGQVVGYSHNPKWHAFLWKNGVMYDIDPGEVPFSSSAAADINNSGQVVGDFYPANIRYVHGFIWHESTGVQDLGTLGDLNSNGNGINNHGKVVGSSENALGQRFPFIWDNSKGMTSLGTLGGTRGAAHDINEVGQVAGWTTLSGESRPFHAFIWDDINGMQDIHSLGTDSQALGINNIGQVVGQWSDQPTQHEYGFIWDDANGMQDIGSLA